MVVFFFFTIYTEIPLFITDTFFIPSFLTVFSIPFFALFCRRDIYKSDALFLLKIAGVLLLSVILSPGKAYIGQKLIGVLQTTVSITAGILLLKLIEPIEKKTLEKVLFIILIVLFIGSLLEISGLIKGLSDSFREAVYKGGYKVYENETRDISIVGFSRPKLFTSEPSLLAIGFLVIANAWLILAFNRKNFLLAVFATLVMLYITGSPILVISLLVSVIIIFMRIKKATNRIYIVAIAAVFLAPIIMFLYLTTEFGVFLTNRMQSSVVQAGTFNITSENLRMVFPYLTLVDIMRASPLFGIGISGKEIIEAYSTLPIAPEYAFGNNNFATLFIYLGIVGSTLFIFVFRGYLMRKGIGNIFLLAVVIAGLAQSMGAFESPRFWGYIFLIIAVMGKSSGKINYPQRAHKFRFSLKMALMKGKGFNESTKELE